MKSVNIHYVKKKKKGSKERGKKVCKNYEGNTPESMLENWQGTRQESMQQK